MHSNCGGPCPHPFDPHSDLTTYILWQIQSFNTKLSLMLLQFWCHHHSKQNKLQSITYVVTISHDLLRETSVQ